MVPEVDIEHEGWEMECFGSRASIELGYRRYLDFRLYFHDFFMVTNAYYR